jgi:putative iron-dependent peroxidase
LRAFPGDLPPFPSTQHALWMFLAHGDASRLFDAGRELAGRFRGLSTSSTRSTTFGYRRAAISAGSSTGPRIRKGETTRSAAAIIDGRGAGLDGGSFVAVQRWVHDLDAVDRMTARARRRRRTRSRDRRRARDAPASAHVKRTAQESFESARRTRATVDALRRHPRARPQLRRVRRIARPLRASAAANGRAATTASRTGLSHITRP